MRSLRQPTRPRAPPPRPPVGRAAAIVLALMVCLGAGATRGAWAAAENPPPPTHPAAAQRGRGFALRSAAATAGAAPSAAAQPSPLAKPPPAAAAQTDERVGVVNFLGETIAWYRQLETEERLAIEPAETLFVDDDRQMALQIAKLAFQYARAKAALLKSEKPPARFIRRQVLAARRERPALRRCPDCPVCWQGPDNRTISSSSTSRPSSSKPRARAPRPHGVPRSRASSRSCRARSNSPSRVWIPTTRSCNSRLPRHLSRHSGHGLSGQIDALERSVPQLNASAKAAAPAAQGGAPPVAATARSPAEPRRRAG